MSQPTMSEPTTDQSLLNHIQRLSSEERLLFSKGLLSDTDRERLQKINVDLNRCWDFLRQRRALRESGRDPDEAHVRPVGVVEDYKG